MTSSHTGMSAKQRLAVATATGRVNIFEGSIRAGKTFSWLLLMLEAIANAGPVGAIIIVGKNRDAVYRNVFEPLETVPALAAFATQVRYRQGAATARIFGRTVHVVGANDSTSSKKIQGMTVQLAFCDEVTVLDHDFFKQLLGRMSVEGARLYGTTNPDSPAHWLKKDYLDRIGVLDDFGEPVLPDWYRLHFTLDDNPSLTEKYKRSIKSEYTGLWYRRFIKGEWVAADGAVYDMWDEPNHVVPWEKLPRMTEILGCGIDYGTTNATTCLMLGLGVDRRLYLVDEWRYQARNDATRWTDAKLSQELRAWLDRPHLPYDNAHGHGPLIVDPAAASFRVQLREDGKPTHPAENDVLYGIRTVSTLLATGNLLVSDRCTGFIDEASAYSWDPVATAAGLDAPIKVNDHSLDGARYAVASTERLWRRYVDLSAPNVAA